jgi:hypothetical protein
LNVDFSNAGVTPGGLGNLRIVSGPFTGLTVSQVLGIANLAVGGFAVPLPYGALIADLDNIVNAINANFENGTVNAGFLQ